ncbi:hypothetical protein VKT23_018372 [Stygiomarasmius scandens]|uniref:Uncharacterized protein n=1 Tax=Marasmiellus scandens TaxID=2682957 RepID=A0ABR1IPI0_9AGAR
MHRHRQIPAVSDPAPLQPPPRKRSRTQFPKRKDNGQQPEAGGVLDNSSQAVAALSQMLSSTPPEFQSGGSDPVLADSDPLIPPSNADQYPPTTVTASGRASRLPRRFRDELPQAAPALVEPALPASSSRILPRVTLIVRDQLKTAASPFRLFRQYLHRPSYDPDSCVPIADLCNRSQRFDIGAEEEITNSAEGAAKSYQPPWPFANMSIWHLMTWLNSGGRTKSESETTRLVNDVILQDDFVPGDLMGFNAHTENLRFDRANNPTSPLENFNEASVTIDVPSGDRNVPSKPFSVSGLYFRNLVSVIKSAITEPLAEKFHFSPFKLFRILPGSDTVERVHSELYNSDAFIQEHDKVQRLQGPPDNPDCKLEKVVLGLMFWSDSTHLTSFGDAKLWPIYLMFGNLSKYIRSIPNSGACHHVAYIPSASFLLTLMIYCD